MRLPVLAATTMLLATPATLGCAGPEPVSDKVVEKRGREHPGTHPPTPGEPGGAALPSPPVDESGRDREITRALELVRTSGRHFLAPDPEDALGEGDEYTAEQFASMLETKREWLGYDIESFDVWLREIASDSFLDRVPYRVVLDDGTTTELRPWLLEQLAKPPA